MISRYLALGALVVAASSAPATAASRVTLELEKASLHEVLMKLADQTGLQMRSQDGAGIPGYSEPTGAKRARVSWKDQPLGHVLRQLSSIYGVTPSPTGDSGFWFRPGELPKRKELVRDGVAFSLSYVNQTEFITLVPGQAKPRIQRNLSLRIACRAEGGDGDILGPVTRLTLVDDRGKKHEAPLPPSSGDYSSALPDERLRGLSIPWEEPHPPRFQRIEGELLLYGEVKEHRFTVPLTAKEKPAEQQAGPVRLKLQELQVLAGRTEVALRLQWPEGTEVSTFGPSAVRTLLRAQGGRAERIHASGNIQKADDGSQFLDLRFTANHNGATPAALEVHVPTRAGAGRKVKFVLADVPTPFGQQKQVRLTPLNMKPRRPSGSAGAASVPSALYDAGGGALVLPAPSRDEAPVEVTVGLSRRGPDGKWSPVRWIQREVTPPAGRLENLAAGAYRVRLRYPRRAGVSTPERVVDVVIRRGQDTRVDPGR